MSDATERAAVWSLPQRFTLVHALRGIAAMWVVLFHASEAGGIEGLKAALPRWLVIALFDSGDLGVAIFFALSGFVIAHSIRGERITGSYVGRFALRRSLRLDPPYWASIAFVVAMAYVSARVKNEPFSPPSPDQLGAHLLYLQTLLGYDQINWVYWTLTFEIQFYIVLVLMVMIAQRFRLPLLVIAFLPLLHSIAVARGLAPPVVGLFTDFWHCFLAGALAYWAIHDPRVLIAFALLALVSLTLLASAFVVASIVTAAVLYLASRTGHLYRGLDWRWLQFLGTISYSLYLIHNPVTGATSFVASRLFGSDLVTLILCIGASILTAWIFWLVIERPSMNLAHRIKLKPKPRGDATPDALPPASSRS